MNSRQTNLSINKRRKRCPAFQQTFISRIMSVKNRNINIQHTNQENYNFEIFHNFIKANFIKAGNEPSSTVCTKGNDEYLVPEFLMQIFSNLFFYDQIYNQGRGLPKTGQHFRIHGIDTSQGEKVTDVNLAFMTFGTIGTAEEVCNYFKFAADFGSLKKYADGWLGLLAFVWFGIKDVVYNLWHLGKFLSMEQMLDEIVKIRTGSRKFIDEQMAIAKRSTSDSKAQVLAQDDKNEKSYNKIMYIFMTTTAKNYRGRGLGTYNHEYLVDYARQNNCDGGLFS